MLPLTYPYDLLGFYAATYVFCIIDKYYLEIYIHTIYTLTFLDRIDKKSSDMLEVVCEKYAK